MPKLDRPGAILHYERIGDGQPLMLLAGLASDHASWGPIIEPLGTSFELAMPDNRGCGQTQDTGPIDPQNWVDDALALADHLGWDRFSILGHSLGGSLAYRIAQKRADRIDALVTLAAASEPPHKARHLMRDLINARENGLEEALFFRFFFQFLFSPPFFESAETVQQAVNASLSYAHKQNLADFKRQIEAMDALPSIDFAGFETPTLAITGENDVLIAPAIVETSLSDHPMVTTLMIEDAAHSIHWEHPEKVVGAIRLYLLD